MTFKLMFRHIFPAFLLLLIAALGGYGWYAIDHLSESYYRLVRRDISAKAQLIAQYLTPLMAGRENGELEQACRELGLNSNLHISIILPNGTVIADSHGQADTLASQKNMPEIAQALKQQEDYIIRFDDLLYKKAMVHALPVDTAENEYVILRAAVSVADLDEMKAEMFRRLTINGLIIGLTAAVISLVMLSRLRQPVEQIKSVARRFAEGDLTHRILLPASTGLDDLTESLNDMARNLDKNLQGIIEQRNELKAVLSSMAEGVLAIDMQEKIVSINQAAARLLGVETEKTTGHSVQEIIRNPDLQDFITETLKSDHSIEASIIWPHGEASFFQLHGTGMTNSRGERHGAVIVLNDMTRLKRLENIRRDFVANVSHELKTPVTSIKGFVETLLEGQFENKEQVHKFLAIIAKQTDRLHAIIEDLLSLSRLEADSEKGHIVLKQDPIKAVIDAATDISQVQARNKNITVIQEGEQDTWAPINTALLEQAVVNLIDNAIKYSRENDVVRIITRIIDDHVVISVKDNGCGIAEELLPRIFERFYVVDKARSRKLGGTGLGLAIVKHIAQAHGGFVTVQSWPGEGSTFNIHIPLNYAGESKEQDINQQHHVNK